MRTDVGSCLLPIAIRMVERRSKRRPRRESEFSGLVMLT
jgi:hypothetical protein